MFASLNGRQLQADEHCGDPIIKRDRRCYHCVALLFLPFVCWNTILLQKKLFSKFLTLKNWSISLLNEGRRWIGKIGSRYLVYDQFSFPNFLDFILVEKVPFAISLFTTNFAMKWTRVPTKWHLSSTQMTAAFAVLYRAYYLAFQIIAGRLVDGTQVVCPSHYAYSFRLFFRFRFVSRFDIQNSLKNWSEIIWNYLKFI